MTVTWLADPSIDGDKDIEDINPYLSIEGINFI